MRALPHEFGVSAPAERAPDTFADRVLIVAEAVAQMGPVSLATLEQELTIPRVSIWRALQTLLRRGWIRYVHGSNEYELAPQVDEVMSVAHIGLPETEEFEPLLREIKKHRGISASVGMFHGAGRFSIVESTHRLSEAAQNRSLIYGEAALAAQLACSPKELKRHLELFAGFPETSPEERYRITSGKQEQYILRQRSNGHFFGPDDMKIALPLRFQTGSIGGLEVSIRRVTPKVRDEFSALAREIRSIFTFLQTGEDQSNGIYRSVLSSMSSAAGVPERSGEADLIVPASSLWYRLWIRAKVEHRDVKCSPCVGKRECLVNRDEQ